MIRIMKYGEVADSDIFARVVPEVDVQGIVADIIADVRRRGDAALKDYALKFDKVALDSLEVSPGEFDAAFDAVEPEFIDVLHTAAANIRQFHEKQVRNSFIITEREGVVMGQKVIPLDRVGLYVPGGTAAYPSTVLMDAIPAKIAGCGEIVITTPPGKDGSVNPAILAAAKVAGVDRVFKVGGAQAVAALAYGTGTVPCVDKIVGPGNAFVAEAKKQVFGRVAIDMIAGPSEILIVADEKSDPACVAADLLSQAEHDELASAILVTTSEELAYKVSDEVDGFLKVLERAEIIKKSLDNFGYILVADTMDEAIDAVNDIAGEHLEILTKNPFDTMTKVKNAGAMFLGEYSSEPLGDYFAGPNHILPTNGTSRFFSPLSVDDFIKKSSIICYSEEGLRKVHEDIELFAAKEGLTAHANSIKVRFE